MINYSKWKYKKRRGFAWLSIPSSNLHEGHKVSWDGHSSPAVIARGDIVRQGKDHCPAIAASTDKDNIWPTRIGLLLLVWSGRHEASALAKKVVAERAKHFVF